MASADDVYRFSPGMAMGRPASVPHSHHSRHGSTSYSAHTLSTADLIDSPPNHNIGNPALKNHLRASHIRARAASSPYQRDGDSVHSSSSETEDMNMFLVNPPPEYNMFAGGMPMAAAPETMHPANAFGRMALSPDQALENLAANVRAATTTSASDRAKQIFVQAWLTANYASYPDGNVPRQGLYFSYRRVCDQYGIPHINTATLGKAIRLCFPTIKTRRLGVRGNSKYHYCGIRPATSAESDFLMEYVRNSNAQAQAHRLQNQQEGSGDNNSKGEERSDEDDEEESGSQASGTGSKRNSLTLQNDGKSPQLSMAMDDKTPTTSNLLAHAQAQRGGPTYPVQAPVRRHTPVDGTAMSGVAAQGQGGAPGFMAAPQALSVHQLHLFPSIDEAVGNNPSSPQGMIAREVWGWFEDHLDTLLESVRSFRFDQFEMHVRTFWANLSGDHREVVHAPAMAGLMAKADAIVYDEILEILRSQMLSPIPAPALASLRGLADKMEKILLVALEGYMNTFVEPKVELGARFGHLVLRFLDIFQVTQALNTVLTNQKQLADMRRSWTTIDFESVRNQSALVCNCRHEDLVQLLEVEFVAVMDNLAKSAEPVRDVMAWADECCERLMGSNRSGAPDGERSNTMSSRSVLIRWGYVTSQIMRDLTIRSDPTFGAFQILKLFLDDWIALNVLRSVALSTNSVAASVESVIQQQFFSLSPMPGQESFQTGNPSAAMSHTPTTSSMLAALQHDAFPPSSLDPSSGSFNPDSYASLSFMDSTGSAEGSGMSFTDFSTGASASTFDMNAFTNGDLGIASTDTPDESGSVAAPEPEIEPKTEVV